MHWRLCSPACLALPTIPTATAVATLTSTAMELRILVVASYGSASVLVFRGTGGGVFQSAAVFPVGIGPFSLARLAT